MSVQDGPARALCLLEPHLHPRLQRHALLLPTLVGTGWPWGPLFRITWEPEVGRPPGPLVPLQYHHVLPAYLYGGREQVTQCYSVSILEQY